MSRFTLNFHAVAAALFLMAGGTALSLSAGAARAEDGPLSIETEALPFNADDPAAAKTGRLAWRGGLVLRSGDERFGGISGLRWLAGDRFLAITDQGDWLNLDLKETDARLTGISAARIGRLTDERGAPLIVKPLSDAEALMLRRRDGKAVRAQVYFERSHRGWSYELEEDGTVGPMVAELPLGPAAEGLPENGGLEAVAGTANGLFLIPEQARQADGRTLAWRRWAEGEGTERRERIESIAFDLPDPYRPTDAHALPGGGILLLSRRYSPLEGVGARLDRLDFLPSPRGGPGFLKRTPIAELAPPLSVDNMEGLAVRVIDGRTFVYLVSDDNFMPVQRTLLMKFEMLPPAAPAAKPSPAPARKGAPAAAPSSSPSRPSSVRNPEGRQTDD